MSDLIAQIASCILIASQLYGKIQAVKMGQRMYPPATWIGPIEDWKARHKLFRAYRADELDDPILADIVKKYLYCFRISMLCVFIFILVGVGII